MKHNCTFTFKVTNEILNYLNAYHFRAQYLVHKYERKNCMKFIADDSVFCADDLNHLKLVRHTYFSIDDDFHNDKARYLSIIILHGKQVKRYNIIMKTKNEMLH